MEDLTFREKDRKNFITGIELNDDIKTFNVVYADGHKETKEFNSVHNFNVYLHQMKEQFYRYEKDFTQFMHEWIKSSIIKSLVELVISLESIIITSRVAPDGIIKTIIIILTILFSLGYLGHKLKEISAAGISLGYLNDVNEFITIQEKLKVPVTDPVTGRKDDWYLANLSDVNIDSNIGLYKLYASSLENDEVKEEESLRLTRILKGE